MGVKKLLILMLVLELASSAGAAILNLDVEVNGALYTGWLVTPGDIVHVEIVQDLPDPQGNGGTIEVDFCGDPYPLYIIDMTPEQVYDPGPPPTWYGWMWTLNGGVEILGSGPCYTARKAAAAALGVGTPGVGSLMDPINAIMYSNTFEFSFYFTQATMVDFNANTTWDNYDGSVDVAPGVMILPEPMTIALLALGGLFLRRRR